ncbi:MAG: sulfate adenylyltransferase [Bacteroidia bacterium]|nr:sulfate adenylyltransferase [Bacteroidia bacterium]
MDVLKLATAGSVDDGKSTLIGRLLFETDSLPQDKLEAIENSSKRKGYDYPDLSLATDGLLAEREQGITIDVAHIYFSTKNRRYIIADSPGHVEYTRNMITGASTAQASIVLIDARNGVKEQTARHVFINKLLGIKQLIFAINKMDLVDYDEAVFNNIVDQITELLANQEVNDTNWCAIPVSALHGDLILKPSDNMKWYTGTTLLGALESTPIEDLSSDEHSRFFVQAVIRPKTKTHQDFRGYAGKLTGGKLSKGDHITVLPGLQTGQITDIQFFNESFGTAYPGTSCTLCLSNDIDISRGSVLVKTDEVPELSRSIKATLCWLDNTNLNVTRKYYFQQGTKTVQAKVNSIDAIYDTAFQAASPNRDVLDLNEVAEVSITLADPIINDDFTQHRSTGRFVLIDSLTNNTVALGLVRNKTELP